MSSALSEALEKIGEKAGSLKTFDNWHTLREAYDDVPALIKACEILAKAAQAVEDGFDCRGAHCPGCMMAAALSAAAEALEKEK